ncbi:hypothetical protein ACMFMG_006902 [Clarireedia jacksonii]
MNMNSEDFVYNPLPGDSIRLVQLEIGYSQHISLGLCVCTLETAQPCTALSYTWGGEVRSQLIELQGTAFRITPNLEAFLLEAKRRIEALSTNKELDEKRWNGGWLWVDSICIDQSNPLERNAQVAMMKNIYERAHTIISWLGKLDDEAKLGMEYVFEFMHEPPNQSSKFSSDIMPEKEWKLLREKAIQATNKIISRSYWTRVWIIQEATTPKESCHSLVWCGSYTDDFESFTNSAEQIIRLSMIDGLPGKLHNVSTDALRGLISIRGMRQNHIATDIIDPYLLLPYAHTFDATDSRDKIFGLSSLVPEQGLRFIVPDYNANAHDIYFRVACNLIQSDRRLDILGFCNTTVGDFDLPSWVPDWTSTHMPKPFLRRTLDDSLQLRSLYNAANNTEFDGSIDEDNGVLYTSGFEFDAVSWLAIPRFDKLERDHDIALNWQIAALAPWSKYITGCTRQEALAHTVCADAACFSDDLAYSLLGKRFASVPVPDHDDDLGIFAWPIPSVRDSTVQRFLFFTNKGYMGLAPYTTSVGDKVCLLKGAQFPIILREDDDDWILIGESYVHGIMDGEGWQKMLSDESTENNIQTFAIS